MKEGLLGFKTIADVLDRHHPLGFTSKLIAQTRDVLINRTRVNLHRPIISPHALQQLIAREGFSFSFNENFKERELLGTQRNRFAFDRHGETFGVKLEVPKTARAGLLLARLATA